MTVSNSTLINLEKIGKLRAGLVRGPNGRMIVVYDPNELARVVPTRRTILTNEPGERIAKAFEMFEDGRTSNEIVIAMRETTAQIREWFEEWQDGGGASRVINERARAELAAVVGEFGTVAELIERVRAHVGGAK